MVQYERWPLNSDRLVNFIMIQNGVRELRNHLSGSNEHPAENDESVQSKM